MSLFGKLLALALSQPLEGYPTLPNHLRSGKLWRTIRSSEDAQVGGDGELRYLNVPLDHFGESGETWQLKYYINDTAFKDGGALLLNMPNEGPTGGCTSSGLATTLTAVAVCAEHRFFGTSVPNNSSSIHNLQYLSVEQNLADQISLVKHVRAQYPSIRKVVAKGGSYSGASAAWVRHAYPESIDAAIAESPPVLARMAFPEYDTSNLVALASPDNRCAQTLARVNEALERQLVENRTALMQLFRSEYTITSTFGNGDFMYALGDATASVVQYGNKAILCDALQSLYGRSVSDVEYTEVFANFTLTQYGDNYFSGCFYNSTCMRTSDQIVPAESARSWYWLKCTELGYFQTAPQTGLSARPRKFNLTVALDQCRYIFPGASLVSDVSVAQFNKKFGGGTFGGTSNIFELDFSDDPWKMSTSVGLIQRKAWALSFSQPYLYLTCDGCAHCGAGVPPEKIGLIDEQIVAALASWGVIGVGGNLGVRNAMSTLV